MPRIPFRFVILDCRSFCLSLSCIIQLWPNLLTITHVRPSIYPIKTRKYDATAFKCSEKPNGITLPNSVP